MDVSKQLPKRTQKNTDADSSCQFDSAHARTMTGNKARGGHYAVIGLLHETSWKIGYTERTVSFLSYH